ncbi:hypothetical protein QE152_g12504 [Popillia japonica]|uniref:Uncharacterized protein n=1 Tax=Popillia japonica TaxID=7064 RepID=A0AAW1LQW8_POPJA
MSWHPRKTESICEKVNIISSIGVPTTAIINLISNALDEIYPVFNSNRLTHIQDLELSVNYRFYAEEESGRSTDTFRRNKCSSLRAGVERSELSWGSQNWIWRGELRAASRCRAFGVIMGIPELDLERRAPSTQYKAVIRGLSQE